MRNSVAIIAACLLIGQAGCGRKKATSANNPGSSSSADKGLSAAVNPAQARLYLQQGKELYKKDEDEQAVAAFDKATNLDPDLAEAYFQLGLAYDALGEKHEAEESYKHAVEAYKKFLKTNPGDAEAYYNLGQTYAGLHLYGEAVREYREAAHLKPDDPQIYLDLGKALTRLAQYDEAANAFQKCLAIDPENSRAQEALEEAREGVNRIKTARKYSEEQLKKQQQDELKKQQSPSASPTKEPTRRW